MTLLFQQTTQNGEEKKAVKEEDVNGQTVHASSSREPEERENDENDESVGGEALDA